NITDEFILPIAITDPHDQPVATIKENDVVICFNFRTDRCRQITRALTQEDFPDYGMHKGNYHYVTMTRYDHAFKNVNVLFENEDLSETLGEVLEKNNLQQLRMAETEKYPHVTFFFSGGREKEFTGETRIMKASPKVATYDLQPEMSAPELRDALLEKIQSAENDFICINFANADMVGHTGVFQAAVKACETVDACVGAVVEAAMENNYVVLLTADHGNSDFLINNDGTPNTAHTTNPVPLFYIADDNRFSKIKNGKLGDIAPTILHIMGLQIPKAMTGEILVE
ncbi:MAG: 2,3-bisphosphoglycerate-independent phosphoglycerate mutase, partial [Chitinophagales bacterium]